MKIETLKELEALVKMCRKHGVRSITIDGITMLIDEQHSEISPNAKEDVKTPDMYTPEDVLMWSATPSVGA